MFDVRLALITDAFTPAESQRHAQLIDPLPIEDINGNRDVDYVTLTTANAKALALYAGLGVSVGGTNYDAEIKFNLEYDAEYDLNRTDGIDATKWIFNRLSVHESGHVLGFVSSTDNQDNSPHPYPESLGWKHGTPPDLTLYYYQIIQIRHP